MNYYKRHIGDYAKDTSWLTTYQHGVYALLLDWYYASQKPIPTDLTYRIVRARSGPERKAVDEVLAAFFDVTKSPGFAHSKRADIDIAKYKVKSEANSLIAQERESTKRARPVVDSCSVGEPSHKPLATSQEEAKKEQKPRGYAAPSCPDDVPDEIWEDWLTLRRAKKAPVTKTVIAGARREAQKAGVPFQQFLAIWCARGSQGLEASWLKPHERAGPSGQSQPSRQAQGVAAILGVNPHDLIADFTRSAVVQDADRNIACDPVPVEPRRLPGG